MLLVLPQLRSAPKAVVCVKAEVSLLRVLITSRSHDRKHPFNKCATGLIIRILDDSKGALKRIERMPSWIILKLRLCSLQTVMASPKWPSCCCW